MLGKFRFFMPIIILSISSMLAAQDEVTIPMLSVEDQLVSETRVLIDEIVSTSFGFIVIRADNGEGEAGGVIGLALIHPGVNKHIRVEIEMINVTPTLFAVMHIDTEPYGSFQYEEVEGADLPVRVDDEIVLAEFEVAVLSVHDQFIDPDNFNRIVLDTATASDDAWVLAYADKDGDVGEVLGHTFLEAGTSQHIPLLLSGNDTDKIHIILHEDTGDPERFEFGETDNVDMPLVIGDSLAMTSIMIVPTVRVNGQIVIGSDLTRNQNEFVPFVIDSVLSDGAGWLVVHVDNGEGEAGDIIGYAPVQDGYNDNVIVEIPQADITPRLFAMLHRDSGEALVYEFGDIEDVDLPARYDDELIMGSAMVIPSINEDITLDEHIVTVSSVLIDTAGWIVIYAEDAEGEPSNIIGYAPVNAGLNQDIEVEIDREQVTDRIFLMLHYDTRPVGVFGLLQDDGSDLPVIFEGNVVEMSLRLAP